MPLIVPVPAKHFTGARRITDDTPRSLVSILNELIDAVNLGSGASHIKREFDHSDWISGSLLIGDCPSGRIAQLCALEVTSPFDGGAVCTVGDSIGQGRLMSQAMSDLGSVEVYLSESHYEYTADMPLRIYFPVGSPTTGHGQITIYLA